MITSQAFQDKFFEGTFKNITNRSLWKAYYEWCIDSKERKYQALDKFLERQIEIHDSELVEIANKLRKLTADETIINILKFVCLNVRYISDIKNYGKEDYWADAHLVWKFKQDDCDGINTLIWTLARFAGIPEEQLWVAIGNVEDKSLGVSGGHFWLLYYSPKFGDLGTYFTIDGTWKPNMATLENRPKFALNGISDYKDIWYIFNGTHTYKLLK
jgi:predicted transglutaminase-like cysteine proteinase